MGFSSALQRSGHRRRIDQKVDESLLVIDRQPNEMGLFDRSPSRFRRRSDDEVAEAPPLDLGGTLHQGKSVGGNSLDRALRTDSAGISQPRFQSRATVREFAGPCQVDSG